MKKPKKLTDRELRDIIAEIPSGASWSPYLHALRELQSLRRAKPKGATIKSWAFAAQWPDGEVSIHATPKHADKLDAMDIRQRRIAELAICGPIVRIEVPAPKERR